MSEKEEDLRAPIATILGHIDHGKTSLLDRIRGTAVQKREAGGITQHIGASFFPMETIKEVTGKLLDTLKIEFTLPGLLIIDTPGHESFINLRARGASVADIAILVIDVMDGFMPQSWESLNLLRARKVPFLIAANKIDRLGGWKPNENSTFLASFNKQNEFIQTDLNERIYEIMGELSKEKFQAERYDRITDFTKNVAIIPTSAKTGEGVADLLMILTGLAQQFLQEKLHVSKGPAIGSILEVKEEPGLGITIDTIIYDGIIKKGDNIVIGGIGEPIITKVRALLSPKPLDEIRDPREKFSSVDEIKAAAGIKIGAPNLDNAVAGASVSVFTDEEHLNSLIVEIEKEISEIIISTDIAGIILKADALGSLEAILRLLKENLIPIRTANVGDVSKRDVVDAGVSLEQEPLNGIILGFNVGVRPDAQEEADRLGIPILLNNIIYRLVEDFDEWKLEKEKELREEREKAIIRPGKIRVMPGFVFRINKPAVVGIEVLGGQICPKYQLIRESDGRKVGEIVGVQDRGDSVPKAVAREEVAISIKGATVGRTFKEGDILYVDMYETMFTTLKNKFKDELPESQIEILDELKEIKRKEKPLWGF
ncbi:MAG: translation initiation factor IF-2 [Candidatus Sifarchaeia archaeon]|jgi:translation initiation factor 5B